MKKLANLFIFIVATLAVFFAVQGGSNMVALAEARVLVTSSAEGSVVYGQSVVLEADVNDAELYSQITYNWLKNDRAGAWLQVATGKVLELKHVEETGDYKCQVVCEDALGEQSVFLSSGKNVSIVPKTINVTIDDRTAVYGDAEQELSYNVRSDAYFEGDDLEIKLERASGGIPNSYRIYGTSYNKDYLVQFEEGSYVIHKKPLEISYQILGPALENGELTEVKVIISGVLEADSLNYNLYGCSATLAGRYTATLDIAPSTLYSWEEDALSFAYTIYKCQMENEDVSVSFSSGVLPEAELDVRDFDAEFVPKGEEIIACKAIYPSYVGVDFDGGSGTIVFKNIAKSEDGYHIYLDMNGTYQELETEVVGSDIIAKVSKSGKFVVTKDKSATRWEEFSKAQKIGIIVGSSVGGAAIIGVVAFLVVKKLRRKA